MLGLTARWTGGFNWVEAGYRGGGSTGRVLNTANRIRDRIFSSETGLAWERGAWSVEAVYRFDDFNDQADLDTFEIDVSAHSGWLQIAYRL